ncbi:Hypothetical_protein [Hexamita inflata]|uniref:Hypothetical_protein n=1 Tax=Hexamita inflata TaxID=28002 RepID=A0ABP1H287_9EUKA
MQILQDCRNGEQVKVIHAAVGGCRQLAGNIYPAKIIRYVQTTLTRLFIYFDKLNDICYQQVLIQLFNFINLIKKLLYNYYNLQSMNSDRWVHLWRNAYILISRVQDVMDIQVSFVYFQL